MTFSSQPTWALDGLLVERVDVGANGRTSSTVDERRR